MKKIIFTIAITMATTVGYCQVSKFKAFDRKISNPDGTSTEEPINTLVVLDLKENVLTIYLKDPMKIDIIHYNRLPNAVPNAIKWELTGIDDSNKKVNIDLVMFDYNPNEEFAYSNLVLQYPEINNFWVGYSLKSN